VRDEDEEEKNKGKSENKWGKEYFGRVMKRMDSSSRRVKIGVSVTLLLFLVVVIFLIVKPIDNSEQQGEYFKNINNWYKEEGEKRREKEERKRKERKVKREEERAQLFAGWKREREKRKERKEEEEEEEEKSVNPFGGENGDGFAFVDLERLDRNIYAVQSLLPSSPSFTVRIVCKSIPSIPLIRYINDRLNDEEGDRGKGVGEWQEQKRKINLMVFHGSFLYDLIEEFGSQGDYLLGLPFSFSAASHFLSLLSRSSSHSKFIELASCVRFLIDTPLRAREYALLAEKFEITLSVSIEIDVGLHRGGARDENEMKEILAVIQENNSFLELGGLMGYDGHCQGNPSQMFIGYKKAMNNCLNSVNEKYVQFFSVVKNTFPSLSSSSLVLNSGGSTSFPYYKGLSTVINDIAIGSAFLMPGDFDLPPLSPLLTPSLFLAGPVTKIIAPSSSISPSSSSSSLPSSLSPVPFLSSSLWGFFQWWNPNYIHAVYVTGIGMPTCPTVSPGGLTGNPFWESDDAGKNIFPTQGLYQHGKNTDLVLGDLVFCRPKEADAMLGYGNVIGLRPSTRIQEPFKTFRKGI